MSRLQVPAGAVAIIRGRRPQIVVVVTLYYVRFVNRVNAVINLIEVEADSDEAAIEKAYRINIKGVGAGFDVIQDGRLVHRHRDR
jgi:hypothetical protein